MIKIACVLKVSKDYNVTYVEQLIKAIEKHVTVDYEFICLSDVDVPCTRIPLKMRWPGWWNKLELFRPDIKGDMFYIDLDTMIVSNIDDIVSTTSLTMLSDFYRPQNPASGLMFLPEKSRGMIWKRFNSNPHAWMRQNRNVGDQAFLGKVWGNMPERWQEKFPNRIVSYKEHVLRNRHPKKLKVLKGAVPKDASIVCFHGYPRPHHINWSLI